jgi:hypothetical protein
VIIDHSLACLSLAPSTFSLISSTIGPSTPNRHREFDLEIKIEQRK